MRWSRCLCRWSQVWPRFVPGVVGPALEAESSLRGWLGVAGASVWQRLRLGGGHVPERTPALLQAGAAVPVSAGGAAIARGPLSPWAALEDAQLDGGGCVPHMLVAGDSSELRGHSWSCSPPRCDALPAPSPAGIPPTAPVLWGSAGVKSPFGASSRPPGPWRSPWAAAACSAALPGSAVWLQPKDGRRPLLGGFPRAAPWARGLRSGAKWDLQSCRGEREGGSCSPE